MFRFKNFAVNHGNSSMKVGVDAVLLGAWVEFDSPKRILDVGCGCGVIAMILAFRYPEASVLAVDIDLPSVKEAQNNFESFPNHSRLKAMQKEFPGDISEIEGKFDIIVSNPPYFNSGIPNPETRREKARHQASLSVFSLIENAPCLLEDEGVLAVIFPTEFFNQVIEFAEMKGMKPVRICKVRNNERRPEKRVMIEFKRKEADPEGECEEKNLVLFKEGQPSETYLELCRDLYLKF